MKKWFIVFLLLTAIAKSHSIELNKDYFKGYIRDTKSILAPKKSKLINASFVVGATVGLYACDSKIQDWSQENRNETSDKIASFAKPFGDGMYTLPPLACLYFYGHFFENEKLKETSLLSLESFVVSGMFTQIIKLLGHRHRPNTDDPYNTWDGPSFSSSNLSFSSGHSCSAFAIATVIASEYKGVISPLAYSIATLTAISRVNDNCHWASDAFFGSYIGYFTAKAIVSSHSEKDKTLTIFPTGFSLAYKF
ncbi:MAG: phosphatase PAP2 family protein [bacterium]